MVEAMGGLTIIQSIKHQIRPSTKTGLQTRNRRLVVLLTGHSFIVMVSLRRPARFGDYSRLPTRSLTNLLSPIFDEIASTGGERIAIEESVAIDRAEVRGGAELDVVFDGGHRVNSDDGPAVASALEGCFRGADSCGDLARRGGP